ncbi:hypothetical protein Tco_1337448 [Tanacetum coccineum]
MTSDHNRSELRIHDHSNEPSSSKLVPKVVPLANKTATSRQELELLFHHHIAMLRTTGYKLLSRVLRKIIVILTDLSGGDIFRFTMTMEIPSVSSSNSTAVEVNTEKRRPMNVESSGLSVGHEMALDQIQMVETERKLIVDAVQNEIKILVSGEVSRALEALIPTLLDKVTEIINHAMSNELNKRKDGI